MLNIVLDEQIEDKRGLRPLSEINDLINESIEVKFSSPISEYDILKKIG